MEKEESLSASASSADESVEETPDPDRWAGDTEPVILRYPPDLNAGWRPLPDFLMSGAHAYINAIVRRSYPANWRQNPAWDMWLRFCVEWQQSGDFKRAMRAI